MSAGVPAGGGGGSQIINGASYSMYSPEWYAARRQSIVDSGATAGKAAGAYGSALMKEMPASLTGLDGGVSMGVSGGGGSGGGMGSAAPVAYTPPNLSGGTGAPSGGAGGSVAPVNYDAPGLAAAQSAQFAQAKDTAARTSTAALSSLDQELGARGMGGGGYEAGQVGKTLARESNTIGEASRAQAVQQAQNEQHVADENYSGRVTQRGQDLNATASLNALHSSDAATAYNGGITQRGQTMQANEAGASLAFQQQQAQRENLLRVLGLASSGITKAAPGLAY